MDASMSVRP